MKLYKSLKSALAVREEVTALKLSVSGDLPPEIFAFPHLRELYLEGDLKEVSKDIQEWKKLELLSLKLTYKPLHLSSIFALPSLRNLKIIETPVATFQLPLGHVRAPLVSLTMKSADLSGLPQEIGMLGGLEELNLSSNELQDLPEGFKDLTRLKRLNLDQNRFTRFPDFLGSMPSLRHLSLDNNLFPEEEKERVQRQFHLTIH